MTDTPQGLRGGLATAKTEVGPLSEPVLQTVATNDHRNVPASLRAMIDALLAIGMTYVLIGQAISVDAQTVRRWYRRAQFPKTPEKRRRLQQLYIDRIGRRR